MRILPTLLGVRVFEHQNIDEESSGNIVTEDALQQFFKAAP